MSEQADTRALRALVHEYSIKRFVMRGPEVNRAHEIMEKLADAAPALLDEVDGLRAEQDKLRASAPPLIDEIKRLTYSLLDAAEERDDLRASLATLEAEVERVRGEGPRACMLAPFGFYPNENDLRPAFARLVRKALAPRAENDK